MLIDFQAPGVTEDERAAMNRLYQSLNEFAVRNSLRDRYYDHKRTVHGLGLDDVMNAGAVKMVLGWCAKSVDALASRLTAEGWVSPGVSLGDLGLDNVWRQNRLGVESSWAITSALIHGVSWLITTEGDTSAGEPEVLILPKDALGATGRWNRRTRRLDDFLSITAVDGNGEPSEVAYYLPTQTLTLRRLTDNPEWTLIDRASNALGYVPVEPIVYRGRIGRPFGSSRVSRTAMDIQDAGLRTLVRSEISAHEYINPVRALLNADMSQFKDEDGKPNAAWYAFQRSKTIALPPTVVDTGGDSDVIANQSFQQIPGLDMGPHMSHLEMFAGQFSAESAVPMVELGIRSQSQPVSAEAILALNDRLILTADDAKPAMQIAFERTAQTSYRLLTGVNDLPVPVAQLTAKFRDSRFASQGAMSDAVVKEIAAGVLPADSDVAAERLGYSPVDIERMRADRARASAQSTILAALQAAPTGPTQGGDPANPTGGATPGGE